MLKKLHEQRDSLKSQLDAILGKVKTEERAMNDEENAEFERIEGKIKNINRTIAAEERARNIPAPAAGAQEGDSGDGEPTTEQVEERAFASYVLGKAIENRAGAQLTQGNNGGIVVTTIADRIIKEVKNLVPFLKISDVITTNGKISIPVYTEDGENAVTADYVDEGDDISDNIGKFITVDLVGYVLGSLALVSNKLKNNTDIDVTSFVIKRVAEAVAEKLEKECVVGTEGKISGILSAKKVITAASASAVTYDELVRLKHSIPQRFRANAQWTMHPSTYTALCQLKDQNGHPYFKESEYKILDLPVIESDSMPTIASGKKVISIGDFTGFSIKAPKSIEVKVLLEKFATRNMIGVLSFAEFDGKISNEQKFSTLQMA